AHSRHTGPELNREQLGVGQSLRALVIEPFARPILDRPLADLRCAIHALRVARGASGGQRAQTDTSAVHDEIQQVGSTLEPAQPPSMTMRRGSSPRPSMVTVIVCAGNMGMSLSAHSITVTPSPCISSSMPRSSTSDRLSVRYASR